jgi:hypothetical protein
MPSVYMAGVVPSKLTRLAEFILSVCLVIIFERCGAYVHFRCKYVKNIQHFITWKKFNWFWTPWGHLNKSFSCVCSYSLMHYSLNFFLCPQRVVINSPDVKRQCRSYVWNSEGIHETWNSEGKPHSKYNRRTRGHFGFESSNPNETRWIYTCLTSLTK